MIKLLSLDSSNFQTGIADSAHSQNSGLFHKAKGITPYANPFPESTQASLLQTGPTITDVSNSVVDDIPVAWTEYAPSSTLFQYYMGSGGHFYENNAGTITDKRDGNEIDSPAYGLFVFRPVASSASLYYFRRQHIGKWDMSGTYPTGWDDEWETGLSNTIIHVPHKLFDNVYFTDAESIGRIYDNAGTTTMEREVLIWENGTNTIGLTDDGFNLVIATTRTLGTQNIESKVYFWDTFSVNWQREWRIPDDFITNIRSKNGVTYVWGNRYLWACTFNQSPQIVKPLLNNIVTHPINGLYPHATSIESDSLMWGNNDGDAPVINLFGKMYPNSPTGLFQPYSGFPGKVSMITKPYNGTKFYVGTTSSAIYEIDYTSSGSTSKTAETIYFDLGTKAIVQRIDVIFGEPLSGSDSLNIDVKTDEDTAAQDWGTYASVAGGNNQRQFKTGHVEAEQLKLILNFNAGNPKIKRIEVYGERPSFI